jgi:hypothetical protein
MKMPNGRTFLKQGTVCIKRLVTRYMSFYILAYAQPSLEWHPKNINSNNESVYRVPSMVEENRSWNSKSVGTRRSFCRLFGGGIREQLKANNHKSEWLITFCSVYAFSLQPLRTNLLSSWLSRAIATRSQHTPFGKLQGQFHHWNQNFILKVENRVGLETVQKEKWLLVFKNGMFD